MIDSGLLIVLLGLTPAFAWGISDLFIGKSAPRYGAAKAALAVNFTGLVFYTVVYLLFLRNGTTFSNEGIAFAVIGSTSFGLAQLVFFKSMARGPISLVSPISSTYPLISLIVGLLFFGASVSSAQVLGILLVVVGVMIASGLLSLKRSEMRLGKGPLLALGAAAGWGTGLGFVTHAMTVMSWQNVFLIELIIAPIIIAAALPFTKGNEKVTVAELGKVAMAPLILGSGLLQMIGLLSLNFGIASAPESSAVVIAISSCYPALTVLLALTHLKEKVPVVPLIGGITGVLGVVILALGA